jgi:hypothetical protein
MAIQITNQQAIQLAQTGQVKLDSGLVIYKAEIINPQHLIAKEPITIRTITGKLINAMKGIYHER